MSQETNSKSRYSIITGFETKNSDELTPGGYIATSHLDSGFYDANREVFIRDKIPKATLEYWAKEINEGVARANKVSVNHNREPHVTGVGIKGSARVDQFADGEYGLYVDNFIDKTKEGYEDTKYRIENNLLDSFSIEFTTKDVVTGEYLEGAVIEESSGTGIIRTLMPGTILEGWTLAGQPMNEHAVMIKEIQLKNVESKTQDNILEENKMSEEEIKAPSQAPVEEQKPVEEAKETLNAEDAALLKEAKERKAIEAKETEYKEIIKQVKEELKESLNTVEIKNKALNNVEKKEHPVVVEFKEAMNDSKFGSDAMFDIAGKTAEHLGLVSADGMKNTSRAESREFKNFRINHNKLEMKGLGITTNQNTDTDYLLSSAELSDVFDPVIFNYLNQKTTTWNILAKDDRSNKGNNQVQFSIKTGKNSSASAYTGNAISSGNVSRLKLMTKFKKYQVGVEIDGDMIAAARGGPIGDVFAQEVRDSTDDLMEIMNQALYAEVGLETAAGVIGFEYITDSAGNTSLYNLTRTVANQLAPDNASDTYINGGSNAITKGKLRQAIRQAIEEGADLNDLVFFVSPVQYDMVKALYDDAQRLIPTSSRFGFEGRMEFDSVPLFFDKDCNDDDIFLVDLATHRIAIWVPPTLEKLGKDSDSEKGFVKTYFATYNRAPRRMVQIYALATS